MLHVTFSNRSEALLAALIADMAAAPFSSPFAAEHLIVPGAAQRRAVTLALADRRGVCANVQFSFLAQWLWAQMGHFIDLHAASPFAAPALEWRIRELFDDTAFVARLGTLRGYVEAADPLLRYELAREVAALFETYVTYRPAWLARWSAETRVPALAADAVAQLHEPWQAVLWARLARDVGVDRQHPSVAFFAAIEALGADAKGNSGHAGLPQRAYFYMLPSVPPLYLQIIKQLARWIDLRLYVLNPCREYWYEIVDRRRLTWLEAAGRAEHHEVGNALLAGWGRQTRATVDLLLAEGGEEAVIDDERFVESGGSDGGVMLARVQDAMLDLVEIAPGSLAEVAEDRSIEVHVCHSLSRQLEALRDQLLALFDADDAPRPSEVLVLLPDLDAAAPMIEAVFGSSGARRIPYAITGRGPQATNGVADLLLRLLALPGTRLAADEVFDLLQHPLVVRRLRLDDEGLLRIRGWVRESGMRWGLDGRQRGASAVSPSPAAGTANHSTKPPENGSRVAPHPHPTPPLEGEGAAGDPTPPLAPVRVSPSKGEGAAVAVGGEGDLCAYVSAEGRGESAWNDLDAFSLRDGLRRLLLGHALPGCGEDVAPTLCSGVLPAGDAVGSDAGTLGALWQFVEALTATLEQLRRPRPANDWPRLLNSLLADWVDSGRRLDEEDIAALQAVRAAIDRLDADFITAAVVSSNSAPISVEVVRTALADRLEGSAHGGVPTGAVTFSALTSFRGISARVICLLGLDDGVFPRVPRPAEFDLMARAPQRGDRQRRDDERNLFLDLLLGARDRFQLYFTGRSIRDNAPLPPSVLIAELLDTLAVGIAPAGAEPQALAAARRRLLVEHPLQSFSLSLFQPESDARRPSYDFETCAAWREALARVRPVAPAKFAAADDEEENADDSAGALPFFTAPLPPPGPEWRQVALPRLRSFFRHPARALLRDRLRIAFDYAEEALPNEDPFDLDWAAKRQLWSALLRFAPSGEGAQPPLPRGERELARGMRLAPAGMVGEVMLDGELAGIAQLAATIARLRAAPARPDHAFALDLALGDEAWQVHGVLTDLSADGQLVVREGDANCKDYVDAWLAHLTLNACPAAAVAPVTTVVARNGVWRLAPVEHAAALLGRLLACYREGLSTPLHFYPRTAWAYLEKNESLGVAQGVWASRQPGRQGEGDDAWWQLALRGVAEPLDARFTELAAEIYGPLRAAMQEVGD